MPNEDAMIVHTYFVKIPRMKEDDMGYTEYLHATYDLWSTNKMKKNIKMLQLAY